MFTSPQQQKPRKFENKKKHVKKKTKKYQGSESFQKNWPNTEFTSPKICDLPSHLIFPRSSRCCRDSGIRNSGPSGVRWIFHDWLGWEVAQRNSEISPKNWVRNHIVQLELTWSNLTQKKTWSMLVWEDSNDELGRFASLFVFSIHFDLRNKSYHWYFCHAVNSHKIILVVWQWMWRICNGAISFCKQLWVIQLSAKCFTRLVAWGTYLQETVSHQLRSRDLVPFFEPSRPFQGSKSKGMEKIAGDFSPNLPGLHAPGVPLL